MKSTSFQKSLRRNVKSTITRFVSIILISFLGAGVFAGLAAVSPNMQRVGNEYYDQQNVMDIRMLSTYGFTDEDVNAIRNTDGVSGVMASYMVDASGSVGDKDYTFRVHGLAATEPSASDYINQLKMIAGHWPENDGEAVIIRPSYGLKNITLGGTVSLDKNSNDDLPDTLGRLEYTVVGVAESPFYISFMQGNTSVGNGMIDYVLYVPQENFIVDGYTDIYVTVEGAKELSAFENKYFDYTGVTVERLEALAGDRQMLRHDEFQADLAKAHQKYNDADEEANEKLVNARVDLEDGEAELADAKKKYADGLAEYDEQKADADRQLADARAQLADAEQELADAKKKYAEGLAKYNEQKADAERQLADAKVQLDDTASKIAAAESELAQKRQKFAEAEAALQAARRELDDGWAEYNRKASELEAGKAALAESKTQLDAAQAEYDAGAAAAEAATGMTMEQIEAALPSMKSQLDDSKAQYETLSQLASLKAARDAAGSGTPEYDALNQQYQAALQAADLTEPEADYLFTLDNMQAQIDAAQAQYDQLAGLVAAKHTLEQKWAEYNAAAAEIAEGEAQLPAAKQALENGEAEYAAKRAELESAREQLSAAENELASAKQAYQAGLAEYKAKKAGAEAKLAEAKAELDDAAKKISNGENEIADGWQEYYDKKAEAEEKLADARAELADAAEEIADGEKELAEGWQEYEDKKLEANTELADAKQKIEDAEEKLSGLGEPKWYVLDRHMNESFVTYEDDTERMSDLATVFPIVFFLVAALVCLTTMTRMVDEDRTLIGTFKALGYSNGKIAGRYLKYAASASLIGSIAGIAVGFWLIPTLVWNAYGIVFALPKMTPAFYLGIGMMSVFATVFITTLSTGIAARNSLRESPADLMRPKAPKIGKRVFLEYIKPVWSRLSFSQKVTVRNLGLNKRRLLMSLVGILGCTALVVTALGANDAVNAIMDDQFGKIFHYNITVGFNDKEPSTELASRVSDTTYFEKSAIVLHKSAEASLEGNDDDTYNIYVVSPKEAKGFTDFVSLYEYEIKEILSFDDNSVVITEKLSMNLNVDIGDTIMVKYLDKDEKHPVKVTGITTNYTFNYVYLGRAAYEDAFGETPEYNQFYLNMANGHTNDEVNAYLSSASGIGAISFTDDLMGNIRTSINSVNNIIWILISAAGLLAFIVLYNLTNINIGERQRELATLKVLGFYDKETYSYIFRETVILSFIGAIVGLFAGIFLYRAVVTTVEADMILLTRILSWHSYLEAAILTLLFTWIVNQCMKPRIKGIDMLESLKSVD